MKFLKRKKEEHAKGVGESLITISENWHEKSSITAGRATYETALLEDLSNSETTELLINETNISRRE